MSDAQVWTVLGILVGAFASLITLTLLVVSSKIDGLSGMMLARFDGVNQRIDLLDRDVQKIAEKVFGS